MSEVYNGIACGEVSGSATAKQLPNVPCRFLTIKALSDNAGKVYVGGAGVTKADGTTDVTTGLHLAAGESQHFFITNLNMLYIICDNAGDDIEYLAQG